MPIIEEFLRRIRGRPRWTPHNRNPADAMTKFRCAHLEPLVRLIQSGFYRLSDEAVELEARLASRTEGTGSMRLKTSAAKLYKAAGR